MNRLLHDCVGSVLVETTIVFPILLLVALGTVDVTYMLYDWALANKAAYVGARTAIVSDPVASGITTITWNPTLSFGSDCFDSTTGAGNGNCPAVNTVCTPDSGSSGTCTDGSAFDNNAFCRIFTGDPTCPATPLSGSMKAVFPNLQRQNVQISYQTNNLGFVGRPDGLPMTITVSINCMVHTFYFIGALMQWTYGNAAAGCSGTPTGWYIPTFATMLTSEDMVTN